MLDTVFRGPFRAVFLGGSYRGLRPRLLTRGASGADTDHQIWPWRLRRRHRL